MQTSEYKTLHDYESWYWWYISQRANLTAAVADLSLSVGARLLDAGCGTGRNLIELARLLPIQAYGVDSSRHAAALWNGDGRVQRCVGSVNEIPHPNGFFDVVVSVDVLGCHGVDISRAIAEMVRVMCPGGYLVLLVPAYQWMRSRHDAAVHSVHRFTRHGLTALVREAGLTVLRATHRFTLLFPFIAGLRLLRRAVRSTCSASAVSDLRPLPSWLNRGLLGIVRAEQWLLGRWSVPFGSTILLVARKAPP